MGSRAGGSLRLRRLQSLAGLFLLVSALPDTVFAQSGGGIEEVMALADSAAADSSAVAEPTATPSGPPVTLLPPPEPWYTPLVPTVDGRIESNVTRIVKTAGIEAPLGGFVNMNGRARFSITDTEYRQFERDAEATNFSLDLNGVVPSWGDLDLNVIRNTSYDENRLPPRTPLDDPEVLVLEYELRELHATLAGNRDLGNGFRAHWGVRGDVEDVQRTDKGVANDRALLGGAADAVWGTRGPWHDFSVRYGYDRRAGDRVLRDQIADAVTERDTVWTRGRVDMGPRLIVDLDARRTTFVEDRLDYARNINGVIDTLGVLEPVGKEHESTWQTSWDMDLRSRPLPRLAVNGGAGQAYSESDFSFSREGLVKLSNDNLDAEGILRYAVAGSLRVRYSYTDRANNRRARGSTVFRGEEARVSKRIEALFRHRAARRIDVHFDLQQTLDQNINESPENQNDRDRLVTRTDLKIISDPWEWFDVNAAAAYSYEEEINIDAARVGNNRNSDLFEVRGSFTIDPEGGWRFAQNYRMQIRIIDRLDPQDSDEFNKQGQWDNRVEYRFANGVFTEAQYIVDYRRNGERDPTQVDDNGYVYGGPRRDHRAVFGVRVPIAGAELAVATERGFLRDESGFFPLDEDRGKFSAGLKGNWQFWRNRGTFSLNATRILQFGPRVRDDQRDYWVMNTSLRLGF